MDKSFKKSTIKNKFVETVKNEKSFFKLFNQE